MRVFLPDFVCCPNKQDNQNLRPHFLKLLKTKKSLSIRSARFSRENSRSLSIDDPSLIQKQKQGVHSHQNYSQMLSELFVSRKKKINMQKNSNQKYQCKNSKFGQSVQNFDNKLLLGSSIDKHDTKIRSEILNNKEIRKNFLITKKVMQTQKKEQRPKTFQFRRQNKILGTRSNCSWRGQSIHSQRNNATSSLPKRNCHKTLDIELIKDQYRPWSPSKIQLFQDQI